MNDTATISEIKTHRKGKELILASKIYAVENRSKSWFYVISTLCLMLLAFIVTFLTMHWSIKLASSIIFGLLLVKFFVIYHDYEHKAILQKSRLAEIIMTVFGIFILAPVKIWKRSHDHHHQNNSKLSKAGIGSYPLITKKDFNNLSKSERTLYLTARHPLTICLGYISLFIFDFNIKTFIQSPAKHWDSLVALILHFTLGTIILIYGGWQAILLSWIIPFLLANGLGSYLFYAQHNFPGASFQENKDWDYVEAALQSTSYMTMGSIMNWFTGNIGFHHVHHLNHRIPFYRLKEAMMNMPELQNPKTTSLHPNDIVACLKLKFWDPEKGLIVGKHD